MNTPDWDFIIIGGGIVGLATAWRLAKKQKGRKILLLEKEEKFGLHQTGHNSGVIHAGVYYTPGSLKARFCKEGAKATYSFCQDNKIPVEQCGKLLVATNPIELERMKAVFSRCLENDLEVELIDERQLREAEPNIKGLGAILVKTTGIVDYTRVADTMATSFVSIGGVARLNNKVVSLHEEDSCVKVGVETARGFSTLQTRFLISAGGLNADRLTRMMGMATDFRIIPFRGEYYQLSRRNAGIVNRLIYPIPDPELPFLGVHLTRMIDGSVTVGPNAVQGWKREGYARINISPQDSMEMLSFPGFWKVAAKHWKTGIFETWNSWFKPGYLKQVQKYCPGVTLEDLKPYPAGIRAQAVKRDGTLVQDFLFAQSSRSLHVCNAPSPAATSAIPIGDHISDLAIKENSQL